MSTKVERYDALKETRNTTWKAGKAILDKYKSTEPLSTEDRTAYDKTVVTLDEQDAQLSSLGAEIDRERRADEARAAYPGLYGTATAPVTRETVALRKDQSFRSWAAAQGNIDPAHEGMSFGKYLRGMVTGDWKGADAERRAMSEGVLSAGGYAVPQIFSSSLIDLARNNARVLEAGATLVPMGSNIVNVPKWITDPTAAWRNEGAAITASDAVLGRVTLTAKDLTALVVCSRELVEDSNAPDIAGELSAVFAKVFALQLDSAALYGTGVAPIPQGLKTAAGVTKTNLATNGIAPTNWDYVVNAIVGLKNANETPSAILWSPRVESEMALLKDSQLRYLAPPTPYLDNVPRLSTNQIPNSFVVGTSAAACSDLIVGDFSQLLIGILGGLQLTVLNELYAGTGQIGFLAHWRGDVQIARPAAFSIVSGIL